MITVKKSDDRTVIKCFGIKVRYTNKNYFHKIIRNLFLKLSSKILKFFSAFNFKKKKYDFIVPFGQNCETGMCLYYYFRSADSTLFNYVGFGDNSFILPFLNDYSLIFSEGKNFKNGCWQCEYLKMLFHSRSRQDDLLDKKGNIDPCKLEEDFQELLSRTQYLHEKTHNILSSDKKKLILLTYKGNDEEFIHIKNIYEYINDKNPNFDFLIIVRKNSDLPCLDDFNKQNENVYVRKINHFIDFGDKNSYFDRIGWTKIFNEFQYKKVTKKSKKLKYDQIN